MPGGCWTKAARFARLRTIRGRPARWATPCRPCRFDFDRPERLAKSLAGVSVLYNTYWVRFNHRNFTFAEAVRNSRTLFHAARQAGVERIVHTSITNPSLDSPLEYFRGKAQVEQALKDCGVSAAVLRPAVLFGGHDILINNMAWTLRHLPVFGLFGRGDYRLQPIHVEDFASLAVAAGRQRDNVTINAIGPETFTYRELLRDDRPDHRPAPAAAAAAAAGRLSWQRRSAGSFTTRWLPATRSAA